MIDTVKLNTADFDLRKLNRFDKQSTCDLVTGRLKRVKVFCNELPDIKLDIKECRVKGGHREQREQRLFVTASLPKLLYGTSLIEVGENDIDRAVETLESKIKKAGVGIDKGSTCDFGLSRVDFCRNIEVRHHIVDYLALLGSYSMTRRDRADIKKETVTFFNGQRALSFYNKLREVKQDKSTAVEFRASLAGRPENILRAESRLLRGRVIEKEFKRQLKFAELFNFDLCKNELLKELNKLTRPSGQLELNFRQNSELLNIVKNKRKRDIFKEFIAIKGVRVFLAEFQFDYSLIKEFLFEHFKKTQTYTIIKELKEYQSLVLEQEERDLLGELRQKIAHRRAA